MAGRHDCYWAGVPVPLGVSTDPLEREPFSRWLLTITGQFGGRREVLFVGDDWAEDHHDVEVQDEQGSKLAARRLPEGITGIARLHELIGEHLDDGDPGQVVVAIETDRGLWVEALIAAGYQVYGLNPRQVARFKERYGTSGAKSDAADAHALADMVRTERHQLRAVAGDSAEAEAIKVAARAHQTLIFRTHPAPAAAALGAAGILPGRARRLCRPRPCRCRHPGTTGQGP